MSNQIVTVDVFQQVASTPSSLQNTGAFVSQGATTLASGAISFLTQASDLTPLLINDVPMASISWSGNVVSVTLSGPHGIPGGVTVLGVIAGVLPLGYNGTFECTSTGADTLTYPLTTNPGSETKLGTFLLEDVQELVAMVTTYFAQGANNGIYVLELGVGTPAQGVTTLTSYIASPTIRFYHYLLPRPWNTETTAVTLAKNHAATTSQIYFWITTTYSNYSVWEAIKSVYAMVEASTIPITEFSLAANLWVAINYNPSATNKVTPMAFAYLVGVTEYGGTATQQTALKAAFVNYVGTGAEGGISNTLVLWGTTMDGNFFNYWYSVDNVQININQVISAAVINGSNNPQAPLYYNQAGINTLQAIAQGQMNAEISFGLALSPVTVNAISFVAYVAANPDDYAAGVYNGLSVTYTPQTGFIAITFYVTVANFVPS